MLVFLFSCLIFLTIAQLGVSQNFDSQNFVVSHWGMEDGLPQSSVNDIIQTQDGYIWLATYGGLVRFDGVNFTTYDRSNTPGMRSDRILHIYEDVNRSLWLSTEDGFLRFDKGKITPFLIYQGDQLYSPMMVKEDAEHRMWLSVNSRMYRFIDSTIVEVPVVKNAEMARKAAQDSDGVWLTHELEIFRTMGDSVYQFADLAPHIENNLVEIVEHPPGSNTLFLASTGEGVIRFKDGELTKFSTESGLASRYTWKLYVDKDGVLWVSSYNGISRWNGKNFTPFRAVSANRDIQLTRVLHDEDGNFWIGSTNDGLYKMRPSIITTISESQGLDYNQMLSLTTISDGTKLFATNCGGVWELKNGKVIESPMNNYLTNLCVWSVFEDSRGDIWFGSRILYKSSSLRTPGKNIGEAEGFMGTDIFAITEDSKGNIWIGCYNGIFVYDGKSFQRISVDDGLSYNDTRTFFEDNDGSMWVGTSAGLNIISNGEVEQIPLSQASQDSLFHDPYVRAIHKDSDGVYWVGTYGNGIFRIKNGNIRHIRKQDGLFDNIVSHIVEDENGNFWMGSNRGIFRVTRTDLNDFSDGKIKRVHSYSYGVGDGMISSETNGGFQPDVINDNGVLYFPTVQGVAVVETKNVESDPEPPKVFIESLRNGSQEIDAEAVVELPYDNAFLEVKYTGLSYREPEKIQFRYQLKGLDDNWLNVGTNRSVLFTKIPPGDYVFTVTASNNDGIWNKEGASIVVKVIPPFWNTPWFYFLVVMFFVVSGPSILMYQIRKLEQRNQQQRRFTEQLLDSQEQERRRIASELHDGLGQQILVIKNRAEFAQFKVSDMEGTKEQLREIAESAKSSINDVRRISHNLRPVHLEKFGLTDALTNLCEEVLETSSIEFSYHVDTIDGFISQEKEINFYRVIQEGSSNIERHSKATEASIMIQKKENQILVTLWDNGRGFDLTQKVQSDGLGFLGMNERVATLGGDIRVESVIGEGTTIKISIPIEIHGS